ncbi:MFS transporter, partial [Salmonella enterica subsp. enterica serovar Weltevreden]|nr:MFS transporter [Salmonella enterica subsp. enterica serovar Weltevreden]
KLGLPKSIALNAVLLGAVAQILFIPVAGVLADRIGRRPVLMIGGIGGALWAFGFFALVHTLSPALIMLASFIGMVLVSFMFSPLASFLPEL